jgi:hypothetical protein
MSKKIRLILIVSFFCVANYAKTEIIKFPKIDRYPQPIDFSRYCKKEIPNKLPPYNSAKLFKIDARSCDIRHLNLQKRLNDLFFANFDSKTKWPDKLPKKYNPKKIMEIGKNPGLSIRKLHRKGITGKGIGIAIIDQSLLINHIEYKDRIKLYEEIHWPWKDSSSMHGPAVTSIAAGKTVGVAPETNIYYIAEQHGERINGKFVFDASYIAISIDRILEINRQLPKQNKIRVISVSRGFSLRDKGVKLLLKSIEKAKKENIFVITTSTNIYYNFDFFGLGRNPLKNPDKKSSYTAGIFWSDEFFTQDKGVIEWYNQWLKIPMDARTTASPTGAEDYVFYADGGLSWAVPWAAGLYALACQVKPNITPELFAETAFKTADTITVKKDGKRYKLKNIINPIKLIKKLQKMD